MIQHGNSDLQIVLRMENMWVNIEDIFFSFPNFSKGYCLIKEKIITMYCGIYNTFRNKIYNKNSKSNERRIIIAYCYKDLRLYTK